MQQLHLLVFEVQIPFCLNCMSAIGIHTCVPLSIYLIKSLPDCKLLYDVYWSKVYAVYYISVFLIPDFWKTLHFCGCLYMHLCPIPLYKNFFRYLSTTFYALFIIFDRLRSVKLEFPFKTESVSSAGSFFYHLLIYFCRCGVFRQVVITSSAIILDLHILTSVVTAKE